MQKKEFDRRIAALVLPKEAAKKFGKKAALRRAITTAFLAGTIADRLGKPMRGMSSAEILEKNGERVTTYVDPRKWGTLDRDRGALPRIAEPSANTGLLLSSLGAITNGRGRYHLLNAAMGLARLVRGGEYGGLGANMKSRTNELARYFTSLGEEGCSPCDHPGEIEPEHGSGNEAVMRAAPLIWSALLWREEWPALTYENYRGATFHDLAVCRLITNLGDWPAEWLKGQRDLERDLDEDERMTHCASSGGIGSIAFYEAMRDLLPLAIFHDDVGEEYQRRDLAPLERDGVEQRVFPLLARGAEVPVSDRRRYRAFQRGSIDDLVGEIGNGESAQESVTLAVWIAIRHISNLREAIIEAINVGGGTSSIGCLVGLLVGLYSRAEELPAEWVEPIAEELLELVGRELVPFLDAHS